MFTMDVLFMFAGALPFTMATMLYNGGQTAILSSNMSMACDAAFNTSISCPENTVQLVTYSMQAVGRSLT
jgi:hypothetical protein